jgi:hypothetical protein
LPNKITKLRLAGKNKIRRYVNRRLRPKMFCKSRVPKPVHKRTGFLLKKDISIIMRMMRRTIQFYL